MVCTLATVNEASSSWAPPCNQFLGQEPGSAAEIAQFCSATYGVDFPLLEASRWRELSAMPEAATVIARGYRVLHDELGLATELAGVTPPDPESPADPASLTELASDFWYHALWTAKKLRRGEVFTALGCLDLSPSTG